MNNPNSVRCDNQDLALHTIIWLEGDWNYTRIYQQNQPARLSAYTLKWYERRLTDFIRVNKDAMVNPLHVRALQPISSRPRRLNLLLTNGEEVEVSRRRQGHVRRSFIGRFCGHLLQT